MKLNKKILSMLLSVTMLLNMVTPTLAVAAPIADSGKAITPCEHHKVHDADCGYTEGTAGTPCTHAHKVNGYTTEPVCGLTEESDTGASASNAAHTHTQDCYKLDCPHQAGQHDAACGYTEGTAGTPCTYDCLICNSKDTLPPATNGDTTIGASSITVTAFDALTTDVQQQSVAAKTALRALLLPTELSATGTKTTGPDSGTPSEAVSVAITLTGITWELTAANNDGITAYDEQAEQGSYIFTPVLPEGYTLGTDVALPRIYVMVGAVNALASVPEQFTLPTGDTYYFDLSGEKSNIGTINIAVPDTTLHYVPFTYAGTVNAYSLTSAMATTDEYANANKSDRSLFVADYNVSHSITWHGLNTANLIFGKTFDTDYKLRSLSAGSNGNFGGGTPATNEWDSILGKSGSTDNANGWIKNWQNSASWGQDTSTSSVSYRALRGYSTAAIWSSTNSYNISPYYGWRPALEVLNLATLGSDGLKAVTLNLNGGKLKDRATDINIVCAGDTFTAPSGEGLTCPRGYSGTNFKWNTQADGKGRSYDVGVAVPSSVTTLYAQWTENPLEEQFTLPTGQTYYFDLSSEKSNIGTINTAVPDQDLHYVPFTYVGTVNAYSLTKNMSDTATTDEYANANKSDRSLFVADYNVSRSIPWDELNKVNLIFGKTFDTDYKLRSLSAGSDGNSGGTPATNEWDSILVKSGSTDNANGWIKNWQNIYSYGQDTSTNNALWRALRGYNSAAYWTDCSSYSANTIIGWRPALEVLNPATLGSDGLKAVTLNLNGGKLKDRAADINIVCAGDKFTAPSGEGLTRPSGNGDTAFHWKGSNNKTYAVGATVPSSVTALTAQWTEKPVTPTVTSVTVSPKTVSVEQGKTQPFKAIVAVEDGAVQTVTWTVTGGITGTSISADGSLTVAADETATNLTVTATSTVDNTKSGNATVTVTKAPATVTAVTVTPDTANVQQGTTQPFSASVTGTNSPAQTVTWTVTGGNTGTSISADGLLTVAAGETATTLTVTATSAVDNTKSGNATVTVTTTPVTKYTLTVTGGTGGGDFESGKTVTITANTPTNGKVFEKWTSSDGVTFADATAESTTFLMPAKNITVTATYKAAPPIVTHTITASAERGGTISPSGDISVADGANHTFSISANNGYSILSVIVDGVNQGAISSYTFSNVSGNHTISAKFRYNDSSEDSIMLLDTSIEGEPTLLNKREIKMQATVDNHGDASVTLTDKAVADAIKRARWDAKNKGTEKNGISIDLNIDTGKQKVDSISVNLPRTVQDILVREKVAEFKITSSLVDLTFDNKALQAIQKQAGGDATIHASRADVSKLSKEARDEIGNRPVFNLSITGQNGENISDFGGGFVKVSIPYTLQPDEDPNNLQAYFVDAQGKLHEVACTYDPVTKCLVFLTNHFSVYGIGYKEKAPKFNDIANHWAKNDIEFVTARGWLTGTGTDVFSPDNSITRGMFVTALGKLAGTDTGSYKESGFSDENAALSRQEMAVFMANYAKTTGYAVPKTRTAVTFADRAKIASWAADAVKSMQMAGVIMGKDGNRFDPTGTATRAEASAVLRRYAELVIDRETAQGLDRNDSGKIVYYENGKLFTGTKTIDGTTYYFGDDGICVKMDTE